MVWIGGLCHIALFIYPWLSRNSRHGELPRWLRSVVWTERPRLPRYGAVLLRKQLNSRGRVAAAAPYIFLGKDTPPSATVLR